MIEDLTVDANAFIYASTLITFLSNLSIDLRGVEQCMPIKLPACLSKSSGPLSA